MSLPELQAWFMTMTTTPGGIVPGEALAARRHGWRLDDVVEAGPHGAAPAARMRVYADGYLLRLLDCLRADYPLLCKLLGDELFVFFARAYVTRHPPSSPSMYDVGAGFAGFLADTQPYHDAPDMQLPIALARLERARMEAGRALGPERVEPDSALSPLDMLMGHDTLLRTPPCLRLLELPVPILAYAEALAADGEPGPAPAPSRSRIAVTRKAYRIAMADLTEWQFALLTELALAGADGLAASACARRAAARAGLPLEEVQAALLVWLPAALAAGLVDGAQSIMPPDTSMR